MFDQMKLAEIPNLMYISQMKNNFICYDKSNQIANPIFPYFVDTNSEQIKYFLLYILLVFKQLF